MREAGCVLPIEIWIWDFEHDPKQETWTAPFGVSIQITPAPKTQQQTLPAGSRWQWMLKPLALLHSRFRHVIFLDADSFPTVDPGFLLFEPQYLETGALFWPDVGRMGKEHPIWDMMRVTYRDEPEFESGQMVLDTVRHREPLELVLKMNREAEVYYKVIWGDKDTFRFAFHKYGRSFAMTPYPLQMLSPPGTPAGTYGVMCQHDFNGNRIFQHRNNVKWDLLAENPRISGYLYEDESRRFLAELRQKWNGRLNWTAPRRRDFATEEWTERCRRIKDLVLGQWLLDDRRPAAIGCCGPFMKWSSKSVSKSWARPAAAGSGKPAMASIWLNAPVHVAGEGFELSPVGRNFENAPATNGKAYQSKPDAIDPTVEWSRGLKCREVAFAEDTTLREGASPEAYWWDLEQENGLWVLYLLNEKGRVARMTWTGDQGWFGRWLKKPGGVVGLKRVETVFPFLNGKSGPLAILTNPVKQRKPVHVANHAYGIGDAITGLHAAAAMADAGRAVVYHTRFARWLQRASHSLLTITEAAPPKGTRDMDADYAEQLRYAPEKVAWYAGQAGWTKLPLSEQREEKGMGGKGIRRKVEKLRDAEKLSGSFVHPLTINREVGIPRLDFPKYVLLAPFAAWEARDWPETHWRRLAWLLKEAGYEIVAIGTKDEAERMERTFNKSYAYWAIDHDPEWVMDAMLEADAVIGLDSGMIHVAGLLGVPAVCIHAHLPPEFLFSHAPTVKSVTPATGCVFCRWQEDRGFMEGCATACSALAVVGPEQVMEALLEMIGKRLK